jgi:serine/threonine protein kinase
MRYLCSPISGHAHPNLVTLFDVRAPSPLPAPDAFVYLVMNDAGRTLSSLRKSAEVLTLPEVKDLAWQLLQALAYIHSAGFVHRDIKSDNVLLTKLDAPEMDGSRTWRLTLLDLGLARSVRAEGAAGGAAALPPMATSGTANVVTPSYRPMEIAMRSGDGRHDARYDGTKVDVFSAGCVIAEMFMLLGGADRQSGGVFDPRRSGVARPTWNREEQIKMILSVLGKPSDVDLAWLEKEDPAAARSVAGVLGALTGGGGLAGWLGLGGGGAAAEPAPTLQSIIPSAPADGLELLRATFALRPEARCSAQQAMEKPFFASLLDGAAGAAYRAETKDTLAAAAKVGEPPELHSADFNSLYSLDNQRMRAHMDDEIGKWRP